MYRSQLICRTYMSCALIISTSLCRWAVGGFRVILPVPSHAQSSVYIKVICAILIVLREQLLTQIIRLHGLLGKLCKHVELHIY